MINFAGEAAAAAICTALERCGAGAVFGLPGGPNHSLFQALRRATPRLIVPTHELAAAFMAGTYGRIDGRPGILLTIPGPGFAYALPGIAEAWQDSAPLVHIVSAPPDGPNLRHRHQGLDQAAMVRPIVKGIFSVGALDELGETIGNAFEMARRGEPGPVMVQLGGTISQSSSTGATDVPDFIGGRAIWKRIHESKKPVLLLGQGCAPHADIIGAYLERTATPAFTTASGRGVIAENSAWCMAYESLRGTTDTLNAFLREADLVIGVGARLAFNGTAGFSLQLPPERLVHIDASAANLNAVYPASSAAAISVETFFEMPECAQVARTAWRLDALAAWRAKVSAVRRVDPEPMITGRTPERFFAQLRSTLPDDALVVTDSGLHQVLARRYFEVRRPHGLLMPTDLQSMGFALPSAIAAKLAAPARPVVALVGDGGALMSGLELAIAVREKLALTVIVFNDGYLNQIRMQQLQERGQEYGVALPVINFKALADTVGAKYLAGNSSNIERIRSVSRGNDVTLIEVPVRDGFAVYSAAAKSRSKAMVRNALGSYWTTVRRWLGR